jgi:hypothetical protein
VRSVIPAWQCVKSRPSPQVLWHSRRDWAGRAFRLRTPCRDVLYRLTFMCTSAQIQSGFMGFIYSKVVKVTCNISKGAVMTLIATDTNRVRELAQNFHSIWVAPATVILAIALSWNLLGVAVLPGLAVMALVIPVNARSSKMFNEVQDLLMTQQQKRLQRLAEVLEVSLAIGTHALEPFSPCTWAVLRASLW